MNLLFLDEDEAGWWRRREEARATRRKYQRVLQTLQFEKEKVKHANKLREYLVTREGVVDFEVDKILEIVADVSGLTSQVIDSIIHLNVLSDSTFKCKFLSLLSQQQYKHVIDRCSEMVLQIAANFVAANMVTAMDYMRRDPLF